MLCHKYRDENKCCQTALHHKAKLHIMGIMNFKT